MTARALCSDPAFMHTLVITVTYYHWAVFQKRGREGPSRFLLKEIH